MGTLGRIQGTLDPRTFTWTLPGKEIGMKATGHLGAQHHWPRVHPGPLRTIKKIWHFLLSPLIHRSTAGVNQGAVGSLYGNQTQVHSQTIIRFGGGAL